MYIIDGIAHAGKLVENIKIVDARVVADGMLLVVFSTGEQRLFDRIKLTGNAFEPLKSNLVFKNFEIQHGVLTWQNGEIDVAPEFVYEKSFPYSANEFA